MATERTVKANKGPFVRVRPSTPFGDAPQELLDKPDASVFDLGEYTARKRDLELARARGTQVGDMHPEDVLPYRFHYVRVANQSSGMGSRVGEFSTLMGYRPVKWEDADQYGIQVDETLGHQKGPDGTVRVGDTMLMVCDAEQAAANYIKQERETQRQANDKLVALEARAATMGATVVINNDEPRDDAH